MRASESFDLPLLDFFAEDTLAQSRNSCVDTQLPWAVECPDFLFDCLQPRDLGDDDPAVILPWLCVERPFRATAMVTPVMMAFFIDTPLCLRIYQPFFRPLCRR